MIHQRGYSLIESIVAIWLISSIVLALVLSLKTSLSLNIESEIKRSSEYAFYKTEEILNGIISDLDSHRFAIYPRIHKDGTISFKDTSLNPVMNASGQRAPLEDSDAISTLKLDLLTAHTVKEITHNGSEFEFLACQKFDKTFNKADYQAYLGMYLEGFVELVGSVSSFKAASNCRDFFLNPANSMSVAKLEEAFMPNLRLIIPIVNHYTIYLDQSNSLRYLSHRGTNNIENQPLAPKLKSLSFELNELPGQGHTLLSAKLKSLDGEIKSYAVSSVLKRINHLNFLFNLLRDD